MNYTIIKNEAVLRDFLDGLPPLGVGELYYVSLLAKHKYSPSVLTSSVECNEFTASSIESLLLKLKRFESPLGTYTNKDGSPISQNGLAVYMSVNPRSIKKAQKAIAKKGLDILLDPKNNRHPIGFAMGQIQKAKSKTNYAEFDFDTNLSVHDFEKPIHDILSSNTEYSIVITQGGFHLLVNLSKLNPVNKLWYNQLLSIGGADRAGDMLLPIPGTTQGDFSPYIL